MIESEQNEAMRHFMLKKPLFSVSTLPATYFEQIFNKNVEALKHN
jgi:hypothetical protein